MDIQDFTYEHQIIRQANYLINNMSDSQIFDVKLDPKTLFLVEIFSYLNGSKTVIEKQVRFEKLGEIIDGFLNSHLTHEKLSKYINDLKSDLNSVSSKGALIKDIIDQMQFIILLHYLDDKNSFRFIDNDLIDKLSLKLETIGEYPEFKFLLNLYKGKFIEDEFPSSPLNDTTFESIIELKLNELIESNKLTADFYKKLKTRRMLFIKSVYNQLDLFRDNSIMKPSPHIIYGIFIAASVLIMFSYNNVLSLNKYESENYLDKEINSNMVEHEIQSKIEEKRKELINFTIPLFQIAEKFRFPLFWALVVYVIVWLIFSILLYLRVYNSYYFFPVMIILVVYTAYLIAESYVKSFKNVK